MPRPAQNPFGREWRTSIGRHRLGHKLNRFHVVTWFKVRGAHTAQPPCISSLTNPKKSQFKEPILVLFVVDKTRSQPKTIDNLERPIHGKLGFAAPPFSLKMKSKLKRWSFPYWIRISAVLKITLKIQRFNGLPNGPKSHLIFQPKPLLVNNRLRPYSITKPSRKRKTDLRTPLHLRRSDS